MNAVERSRQHRIAEEERIAQGLPARLDDASVQARILSTLGVV